ncbi:MAG: methylated-DNA--[protein]-cysteine S-methyltransferase [Phycisphaerae bacterium]|nr:methylated-DNA--[protein]-cysteine S-methyltransferase [Phycisphaerae bacterium]
MTSQRVPDYVRVGQAIEFIEHNWRRQPTLGEIAQAAGLSEFHFQRVFARWAGISPKRFLQALTLAGARTALDGGASVLDASLDVGLSGPGRLHDLFVNLEAVTPGEFKTGGDGLRIEIGRHRCPFGTCLIGVTERGVCWLGFADDVDDRSHRELQRHWPEAQLRTNQAMTKPLVERVFAGFGASGGAGGRGKPLRLLVRGTNFQVKVWEALLRIPLGRICSYQDVAAAVGSPRAMRAVGQAVGANPISWLIPCHRVLRSSGAIGGYGGGLTRKRAMLAWEMAQSDRGEGLMTGNSAADRKVALHA